MSYDVFLMCNPLYDIQAEVSDALITELGLEKGGMHLIDEEPQRKIVTRIYDQIVNAEPGGSGANTAITLALLGGKACFTGKLANDDHGQRYESGMHDRNVILGCKPSGGNTGICVVLLTPDAERTMCTFLGASRQLGPDDVSSELIGDSRFLYVTGYLWDTETQKAAVLRAMREARAAGVKVALSLSDSFCVNRHRDDFLKIIQEHVDMLIGNHEEMMAVTGESDPEAAIRAASAWCDLCAMTMGSEGAMLMQDGVLIRIPIFPVKLVDTTGAGDAYAAGLLYGLSKECTLETTGRLAGYIAAQAVAKLGPRLDIVDREVIDFLLSGGIPVQNIN